MVPNQIDRYQIQERLGRGGMGVVYRAHDPQVERSVALKAISIADPDHRARFQREVWAAGRLIHPHIVTLFDAGQEGDVAFIVMEMVEGETLAVHIHRGLAWRQAVTLLIPICQALHYAHSQGVIHRDLKPANILITHDGVPKLTDFGLAHVATKVSLTPHGTTLGTPGYTSPEQLRGEASDGRSDLFSLGVILFEAVSGQHPFEADSVNAMLGQIASDEPVNLEPLVGQAPPTLVQVIGRALAKEPQARYARGDLLAAALANCLSQEGTAPYAATPAPDTGSQIRHATGIVLSEAELILLARAFAGSGETFVEREFDAGFSAARVLLVRPGSGQAQVVAKLGPQADLRREWDAYRALVKDFSPLNTAQIQGEPVLSDDGQSALLRYTFAGGDSRRPTASLRAYYEERGGAAAAGVLNRVVRVFGRQWWARNYPRTFALSEEYDRLLPVHLKLDADDGGDEPSTAPRLELAAGEVNVTTLRNCHLGQRVRLLDLTVSEVRPERDEMTLTAPPPSGEASANLRLRVGGGDPAAYRPGDRIAALDTVVTATRRSLLVEAAEAAVPGLDPTAKEVRLGDVTCPNPLCHYPDLLDPMTEARWSIIHGDLNLENVLVDGETGFAWLIDFADTRQGPALYDLQRLEAQVITKLLPSVANQSGLGLEVMVDLYRALHADAPGPIAPHPALQEPYAFLVTLRRLARQFLMDDVDWSEYYRGLALTLLGTLKFAELGPTARALAFAGAAVALDLIGQPSPLPPGVRPEPRSVHKRRRLYQMCRSLFINRVFALTAVVVLTLVAVVILKNCGSRSSLDQHDTKATRIPTEIFVTPMTEAPSHVKITPPTPTLSPTLLPLPSPSPPPTAEPILPADSIAVISSVQGKVKVQRNEERLITAVTGLALFEGDVVTSLERSQAHIYCLQVGLFKLSPSRAVVLTCDMDPPAGLELIAQEFPSEVNSLTESAANPAPPLLDSLASVRGVQSHPLTGLGNVPILLSPRQLTLGPRPVIRWTAVTHAESYTLKVEGKAVVWEATLNTDAVTVSDVKPFVIPEATVLEMVYPADAPPLEPGITYIVTLQAHLPGVEAPQEVGEFLFFELVDEDTAAALSDTAGQIGDLEVPDGEKTYLLALLYRQQSLWTAAASQMEILAHRSPQSPPLVQLGDLYLRVGLTDLAQTNYQRAFEMACTEDDPYTQAAALTGMGQAAYTAKADAQAVDYFEQALALYRELAVENQVSAVESLLAELSK